MPTRANEFRAYFTLAGEFDPAEVTSLIGMAPSRAWKKGDLNERTHMERKFSRWSLDSRLDQGWPIVEHMRDVLSQLIPHAEYVRAARDKFEGWMQTVAFFHSEAPCFTFDEDVIRDCATLNLSIDCDFYTLYSDRREDS